VWIDKILFFVVVMTLRERRGLRGRISFFHDNLGDQDVRCNFKKGGKVKKALFFVLIFCIYSIADASCIRCALDKLVCEGDSKFDAIDQCGNPDSSEIVGEDAKENISSGSSVKLQERSVEKMYYNCGDGKFIKILTIRDGKIISIDEGNRGSGPVRCY
jgi:hypothetical protein